VDPGQWRCEKCDKTHPKPEHRYILSISVLDHTGQLWLSCFDEAARVVMGMSADQLVELRETEDTAYTSAFEAATCQTWMFKCRASQDTYQDVQRVRYTAVSASHVNFPAESAKLVNLIKLYES